MDEPRTEAPFHLCTLTVDGAAVDPRRVVVAAFATRASHEIALRIPLRFLVWELKETGVSVSNDGAVAFITENIRRHPPEGMMELCLGCVVASHRALLGRRRPFLHAFVGTRVRLRSAWKWQTVYEVARDGDFLQMNGTCDRV